MSALRDGLVAGVDLDAGVVTLRSLGEHLERRLAGAALLRSASPRAVVVPRGGMPIEPAGGPDDLSGIVLPGQFRVAAEIGRGSFAIVYRAHQELVGRDVAIKVLQTDISPDAARMFVAEVRAVARLDHRNVVRVFHADVTPGGRMFVAMELLSGRTLQQVLDDSGALPLPRALAIARQLLAGLAVAHAGGIIHADVKPANIFIEDGEVERVVLLDFGLSRLRASAAVSSLGGTPAYMAPEQIREGRVEVSSDLYAAALVIIAMLVGRRPVSPDALTATIEAIDDERVRTTLVRALEDDPGSRMSSAGDMAAGLTGDGSLATSPPRPPFRPAAPFSEQDHADFFGRDREIELLVEHVLFRRAVIYVAPSGTGKTSLLRAGLLPRLSRLGLRTIYVACRPGVPDRLASTIDPDAASVADAIARHHAATGRGLTIIIDQIESVLLVPGRHETVVEALEMSRWPAEAQASVVFSVREEYLARLLDRTQRIEPGMPVVRLGPLMPQAARDALIRTLEAHSLAIEPALVDVLIADLARAAARIAIELGWGTDDAIYPPHLQLAGAVMHEALPAGQAEIPLSLYRKLGGLDKIMSEHLHHVLEGELSPEQTGIARDLLLALVTSSHTRTARAESELVAIASRPTRTDGGHPPAPRTPEAVLAVVAFLRSRGLLVSMPGPSDESVWDLAHDSLVQRVEVWITSTDLARLRALELVRYHLRRSSARSSSLLGAGELTEIRAHLRPADLAGLDDEWARPDQRAAPATGLVRASRGAIVRRRVALAALIAGAMAVAATLAARWQAERDARLHETRLRDRDIGHFILDLRAFDWDPDTLTAHDVALGSGLSLDWELRKPAPDDDDGPGEPYPDEDLVRKPLPPAGTLRSDHVTARGGPAVLVIRRNDPRRPSAFCGDIIVPIRKLPGYSTLGGPAPRLSVRVPSCAATGAAMVEIPGGPFIAGGQGDPRTPYADGELPPEATVDLPRYWIDRTEVTIAAMHVFLEQAPLHGIAQPLYPSNTARYPSQSRYPASAITWREARAFCRYFGKDLPTMDQWDKALRGGTTLDGSPNPCPRRNFVWCGGMNTAWANVRVGDQAQPMPVRANKHDVSPYGIADMVGNVQEWTRSPDLPYESFPANLTAAERFRRQTQPLGIVITRGCNWGDLECSTVPLSIMPIPNPRLKDVRYFTLGMRCAASGS